MGQVRSVLALTAAPANHQTLALHTLARQLPRSAHGFSLFACTLFRGFFVIIAKFHLPEDAFPLHLLLQSFQRLIDVVVTNMDLHAISIGLRLDDMVM